jgi:hypothetical protein
MNNHPDIEGPSGICVEHGLIIAVPDRRGRLRCPVPTCGKLVKSLPSTANDAKPPMPPTGAMVSGVIPLTSLSSVTPPLNPKEILDELIIRGDLSALEQAINDAPPEARKSKDFHRAREIVGFLRKFPDRFSHAGSREMVARAEGLLERSRAVPLTYRSYMEVTAELERSQDRISHLQKQEMDLQMKIHGLEAQMAGLAESKDLLGQLDATSHERGSLRQIVEGFKAKELELDCLRRENRGLTERVWQQDSERRRLSSELYQARVDAEVALAECLRKDGLAPDWWNLFAVSNRALAHWLEETRGNLPRMITESILTGAPPRARALAGPG